MVPNSNLVVVDLVAAFKEFILSLTTSKSKSQVESNHPPSKPLNDVTPFFEELKQVLQQHGIHIFQTLTDVSEWKQQIHDLVEEVSKHQNSMPAKESQEFLDLSSLLGRILKSHIDLEGKSAIEEVINFKL